ncbi:enoyl-CoA hydratase [Gottfriedia solisilvae]|uniref:Enoyl-CoA hydratase n=1 Tax=Gottfriedia solisilvae TaxID=1516104 RepID=A0A8J3AC77_9BACI|nr:enoyl-CoA hydratase [Gottfriedia solisilvae]GGI10365.1 enoyl-CoA hydratase [Gottfriedia solisilvae]
MGLLQCSVSNGVAFLTIQNPPANAMSSVVFAEMVQHLEELEKNDDVRVLVFHGEGRFFSAGADIKEFTSFKSADDAAAVARKGQLVFERVENYSKPIIAAIHGAALGGGLEFAMSCHIRVVAENAKLGLPELNLGIIPGFAGTQRLPRYVGRDKALLMMATAETISGVEAGKYGLATIVVPEEKLLEETTTLASKIAHKSKQSIEYVLQLLSSTRTTSYHEGVEEESRLFGDIFTSEGAKEGISAFLEKRKPVFHK